MCRKNKGERPHPRNQSATENLDGPGPRHCCDRRASWIGSRVFPDDCEGRCDILAVPLDHDWLIHALYLTPRAKMMQAWADYLMLCDASRSSLLPDSQCKTCSVTQGGDVLPRTAACAANGRVTALRRSIVVGIVDPCLKCEARPRAHAASEVHWRRELAGRDPAIERRSAQRGNTKHVANSKEGGCWGCAIATTLGALRSFLAKCVLSCPVGPVVRAPDARAA